jgi:hypothetical protein
MRSIFRGIAVAAPFQHSSIGDRKLGRDVKAVELYRFWCRCRRLYDRHGWSMCFRTNLLATGHGGCAFGVQKAAGFVVAVGAAEVHRIPAAKQPAQSAAGRDAFGVFGRAG